ncbi:MAG: AIR synthase-related protein [Nitriliruptoraceae bacterium]
MPTDPLPTGKLPAALLAELLASAPSRDDAVLLGPAIGEDAAALQLPADVIVAATDPITLTSNAAGRYVVIINANDVAVTGALPRWFLVTMLLPPTADEAKVRALFTGLRSTLDELEVTLIGGHSEVTPAVTQPVLVGHMLGTVVGDRPISSSGARAGDVLVQVGPVPIEGAAVLAEECRQRLGDLPTELLQAAERAVDDPGISVVAPALLAAELGATAMHDPTEGGLAAGLGELADASGIELRVHGGAIERFAPGVAICDHLGADPLATLASGALLATFPAHLADAAVTALRTAGHPATPIGEAAPGSGVLLDGQPMPTPTRDEVARLLAAG